MSVLAIVALFEFLAIVALVGVIGWLLNRLVTLHGLRAWHERQARGCTREVKDAQK